MWKYLLVLGPLTHKKGVLPDVCLSVGIAEEKNTRSISNELATNIIDALRLQHTMGRGINEAAGRTLEEEARPTASLRIINHGIQD